MNMMQIHTHEDPPAGAGDPAAAAAAAAAAAGEGGAGGDPSLLQQGAGANDQDWIPEKYRTLKEGTQDLDLEASARKLGEGYKALAAKLGSGATGTVPATPAEYKLTAPVDAEGKPIDGIDVEAFASDPLFKGIAERAHAKNITNETLDFFVGEYLQMIPGVLESNQQLSANEARAELGKVWGDDQAMAKGLTAAARAAKGFGAEDGQPGSFAALMKKFGNDPDFLAFAAKVGGEMAEDRPISGDPVAEGDWQAKVDAIKADPAYMDATNPKHAEKVEALRQLYDRRFGTSAQKLGATATR